MIHALDPNFAAVLENLTELSDGDLGGISSDDGRQRPGGPLHPRSRPMGHLLLRPLDRRSRSGQRIRIWSDSLAPMVPVTIPSRDGLELHSYRALPVGVEPTDHHRWVLLVHGGPWSRDCWGFQPDVQMLANRGYAVLQVNFAARQATRQGLHPSRDRRIRGRRCTTT